MRSHIKPSTPRIWRTTTQALAILEVIKNGTNHRVLPLVGGNGAIPGGAHDS